MKNKKTFFFWKLYQNTKTLAEFDFWSNDLLSHKLSFFSTNTPFFAFFLPFLTKNSETILQMAILGEKQKNFFFQNFIKMLKTLWSSIFDQRICWVTNWVFQKNTLLFCPFWPQIQKPSYKWPFWVKNRKTFFFWKLYQNAKTPCCVRFEFLIKEFDGSQIECFFSKTPMRTLTGVLAFW